jgi:hypothetical protein
MTSRTNEKPNFNATDAAEPINSNSSQEKHKANSKSKNRSGGT